MNKKMFMGMTVLSLGSMLSYSQSTYAQNSAVYTPALSMFAEYSHYQTELKDQHEIELKGLALGVSTTPHQSGWFGKIELLHNDDYAADYVELMSGVHFSLLHDPNFYALATLGFGYAWLDSDDLRNGIHFLTLPIGLELGITPIKTVSIYSAIGYKWLWDNTSETTCHDGTRSDYACEYHGGIKHNNDMIGHNSGMTYKAGIRFNF